MFLGRIRDVLSRKHVERLTDYSPRLATSEHTQATVRTPNPKKEVCVNGFFSCEQRAVDNYDIGSAVRQLGSLWLDDPIDEAALRCRNRSRESCLVVLCVFRKGFRRLSLHKYR